MVCGYMGVKLHQTMFDVLFKTVWIAIVYKLKTMQLSECLHTVLDSLYYYLQLCTMQCLVINGHNIFLLFYLQFSVC